MKMPFVFLRDTNGLSKSKKAIYWSFRFFILVFFSALLTFCTLKLSTFTGIYENFAIYFEKPLILLINFLPIFSLFSLTFCLYGKLWPAFLTTAIPFLSIGLGNYYKLKLRGDTALFSDIKNLFLGITVAVDGEYGLTPDIKVWFILGFFILSLLFFIFLFPNKISFKKRIKFVAIPLALFIFSIILCFNSKLYSSELVCTQTSWAQTQHRSEHGAVYSFINSTNEVINSKPKGYNEKATKNLLNSYPESDIPTDKKVNIIMIMREGSNDISKLTSASGIDWSCYDSFKELQNESYTGKLFTNVFAGGTVDTERCVVTGSYTLKNNYSKTNSYARYFKSQGYTVVGSHPSNDWFYNRKNMNKMFGFDEYLFIENYFNKYFDSPWSFTDKIHYDDLILQFENRDKSKPYFNFSVTIEGHAPYRSDITVGKSRVNKDYTPYTQNVLNNYLNITDSKNKALREFVDYFKTVDEPVVLCVFGDHNPWLGDAQSVYAELGINLDLTTQDGLYNYYQTEYLIWGNDAAKEILGNDFKGQNETVISPCFLMNVLFEELGFEGPAYMKYMNDFMKTTPIITSSNIGIKNGTLTAYSEEELANLKYMTYFWNNNLIY